MWKTYWVGVLTLMLVIVLFIEPRAVFADETHYENFRFGQTAIGFGGAVSGFLTEPEATYYNPGGLGFLKSNAFSGSLHFFGFDTRILRDWVVLNNETLTERDGRSEGFLARPTSSVLVMSFGEGKHVLAYSTFVSQTKESFVVSALRDEFPYIDDDGTGYLYRDKVTFSLSQEDQLTFTGPSYGLRVTEAIGMGLSAFYTTRTYSMLGVSASRYLTTALPSTPFGYDENLDRVSGDDGGLCFRLGVMWKPNLNWSFGAVLGTPSIHLFGSGSHFTRIINTEAQFIDEPDEETVPFEEIVTHGKSQTQLPWFLGTGVSFVKPGEWRLAASTNMYLPYEYDRLSFDKSSLFSSLARHELTVNAAVGGELFLATSWPLRGGLFTNLSSAPDLTKSVYESPVLEHVDKFGASLSIGYQDNKTALNLGVEGEYGQGRYGGVDVTDIFSGNILVHEREQYRMMIFISGAVSFVTSKAGKALGAD